MTPLFVAKTFRVVRTLLSSGADVNIRNKVCALGGHVSCGIGIGLCYVLLYRWDEQVVKSSDGSGGCEFTHLVPRGPCLSFECGEGETLACVRSHRCKSAEADEGFDMVGGGVVIDDHTH